MWQTNVMQIFASVYQRNLAKKCDANMASLYQRNVAKKCDANMSLYTKEMCKPHHQFVVYYKSRKRELKAKLMNESVR
jgi:hypothetical protein